MTLPPDPDLSYLQLRLRCLDAVLRREVRRWQYAGRDPSDAFRGLFISDADAANLALRPPLASPALLVPLPPEEEQAFQSEAQTLRQQAEDFAQGCHAEGFELRLRQVVQSFGLDSFEEEVLLICLAPDLDQRYERIYSYLQDDVTRKRPSIGLTADLLASAAHSRPAELAHFAWDAPLIRWELVEKTADPSANQAGLLSMYLRPNSSLETWLLGRYQPHAALGESESLEVQAQVVQGQNPDQQILSEPAWAQVEPVLRSSSSEPGAPRPILGFWGSDTAVQQASALRAAQYFHRSLLSVDLRAAEKLGTSAGRAVHLALRDARLTGSALYLTGFDAVFQDGDTLFPPRDILEGMLAFPDLLITSSHDSWRFEGVKRQRRAAWFEFTLPDVIRSTALWSHFLQAESTEVARLASQFRLSAAQIRDAVQTARDESDGKPLSEIHLFNAARLHSSGRLDGLARKISRRYEWEDLVLPPDPLAQLKEIASSVRGRGQVLETWGAGRKLAASQGITALFAGPPGTGKTMAAQVIAAELHLDLYKIDLSGVVSKYIGETEKNLDQVFSQAENSNVVLFFDEADALFGKRSEVRDAHDRYANIEISFLLQRMELYDGMTILATNLRSNLDDAFTRRLQFAIDFPFPEEEDRLRIWQTLIPPEMPCAGDLDLAWMARRFKFSGGNIRNVILSAAYLASANGGMVTMQHLLHGARRELQKMGRMFEEDSFTAQAASQNGRRAG